MYELFEGNCLEKMKLIPDGSVDMVLCDLPYGTTQNKWDSTLPLPELWREYTRVAKKHAVHVFTASQPFTTALAASNIENLKYAWVWKKSSVTGHLNAHHMPMKNHEDVLVFYSSGATYNPQDLIPYNRVKKRGNNGQNFGKSGTENFQAWTNYPKSILEVSNDNSHLHPTQKPVALMEYMVRTYTNPGETVLDNCMGSGTTGVACANAGRKFIGIELDPIYFLQASERIKNAQPTSLAIAA